MSVAPRDTVFPPSSVNEPQLRQVSELLESETGLTLLAADGRTLELHRELRNALAHATRVLSKGLALEPLDQVLSTQEAANALGVSRPTLVKLLESGEIAFTQPRRHRRIQLKDLRDYQENIRRRRREELDAMTREAAEDDAYRTINGFTETR